MKKFKQSFAVFSHALEYAAVLANMENKPYYVYKGKYESTLTDFDDLLDIFPGEKFVVHPFEPSEMYNKENGLTLN